MATTTRKTLDCGHDLSPHGELDTGYATDANDQTMCYDCAAWTDIGQIVNKGRGVAYLSGDGKYLTTWPGLTLGVVTRTSVSRSNFGGTITRVWSRIGGVPVYGMGSGRGMAVSVRRIKG